jgi:hypothetical protein
MNNYDNLLPDETYYIYHCGHLGDGCKCLDMCSMCLKKYISNNGDILELCEDCQQIFME